MHLASRHALILYVLLLEQQIELLYLLLLCLLALNGSTLDALANIKTALLLLIYNEVPHFIDLQECHYVLNILYGIKAQVNHCLRDLHCFLHTDEILLITILAHHIGLHLGTFPS